MLEATLLVLEAASEIQTQAAETSEADNPGIGEPVLEARAHHVQKGDG